MEALRIYDLLKRRALVSRESARAIGPVIAAAIAEGRGRIELDFSGVDAITPSFLDEVLAMIDQQLSTMKEGMFDVIVLSPPDPVVVEVRSCGQELRFDDKRVRRRRLEDYQRIVSGKCTTHPLKK